MGKKELSFPEIKLQGIWYIPTDPEHQVAGTLEFSANRGSMLETIGSLLRPTENLSSEELAQKAFSSLKIPIILGEISHGGISGEKVTLYRNVLHPEGIQSGVEKNKCSSTYLIRGWHLVPEDDVLLDNVSFHFSHLEEWLRIQNLNIYAIPDSAQSKIERIHIDYAPMEERHLCKTGGFDIYIRDKPIDSLAMQLSMASFFSQHVGEITISENKRFELRSSDKKTLDEYMKFISRIQDFLVFLSGQSVAITSTTSRMTVRVKKYKTEPTSVDFNEITKENQKVLFKNEYFSIHEDKNSRVIEEEVEEERILDFYFKVGASEHVKSFDSRKVLLFFSNISNSFGDVFAAWCKKSEQIHPVISLYLGLSYLPARYLVDHFLSLAQAIEAIHRILYGGQYMKPDLYKETVLKSLSEAIDSASLKFDLSTEFSRSLKGRLSYLYEFSLRKRLNEVIKDNLSFLPDGFLDSRKSRENFVDAVVHIRNSLTHIDQGTDVQSIISPQELNRLSMQLEALLRACLMKTINVEPEVAKQRLNNMLSQ